MGEIVRWLIGEWGVICRAPATFIAGAILISGATWVSATAFYKQEVAAAHQERDAAQGQRDLWKDKAQAPRVLEPEAKKPRDEPAPPKQLSLEKDFHKDLPKVRRNSDAQRNPKAKLSSSRLEKGLRPAPFEFGNTIIGRPDSSFQYGGEGGAFLGNVVTGYGGVQMKTRDNVMGNNSFVSPNAAGAATSSVPPAPRAAQVPPAP